MAGWRKTISAVIGGAFLGGCGLHARPVLTVKEMRVGGEISGGAVVTLVIEASNSGDEALVLGSAAYDLTIGGAEAFAGRRVAQATVPAGGSVIFELPAPVDADLISGPRVPYAVRGVVEYIPPGALGEALFDAKVRRGSASFRERGEFVRGSDEAGTTEAEQEPRVGPGGS